MARMGEEISFGDTENQAMSRLAQVDGIDADPTIDEENEALLQARETTDEGEQGQAQLTPNTTGEQVPEGGESAQDGLTPLPEPFGAEAQEDEMLPSSEAPASLDPANPLDAAAMESQEQARAAEQQGPQAYQASPDFTPEDALEEGSILGLEDDGPKEELGQ
jgi:hypothetical protein